MTERTDKEPELSFCEPSHGVGRKHLRWLSSAGLKLGGGIDTKSLCGRVGPHSVGGWDLEGSPADWPNDRLRKIVCSDCMKAFTGM